MTSHLLAQESSGVLLRSFLIALVLVAPVAAWQWRRIRARRAADRAQNDMAGAEDPSAVGADPQALETVISVIPEVAASTAPGETASVHVPAGVTLEGRPTSPMIVEQIVRDALARDGLEVIARGGNSEDLTSGGGPTGDSHGWTFECRRK